MSGIPSPLNRVIATQRRVQTQHAKARPAKVPAYNPNDDDYYFQLKQDHKALRPKSTGRIVRLSSIQYNFWTKPFCFYVGST